MEEKDKSHKSCALKAFFIGRPDVGEQVEELAEKACLTPDDVKQFIYNPLRSAKIIDWRIMHKAQFIEALLPHLKLFKKKPTVAAIQRAFRENA